MRVVGNPGVGLLNGHRPSVCNDIAFRSCLTRLHGTCGSVRVGCFRSGVRKRVVSYVRRANFRTSNVVLGTKTCARASVTLRSTVHTIATPMVRMRVSGMRDHRSFHRISVVTYTYGKIVYNFKLGSCHLTLRTLEWWYRGGVSSCGWYMGGPRSS